MFKVFSKIEFNHYKNERNFSTNLPKSMHLLTNKCLKISSKQAL